MKKILTIFLIILVVLSAFPFTAMGQENSDISQYLDKTLSELVSQKHVKGAIVSVVSNSTNELCVGYGFADEENGIAAHEDKTAFRIGSLSKTFVPIATQQLVQAGKLDMDAPVSNYLEADFPKFKYDISMHNLLTHTAGFEDVLSGMVVMDVDGAEPLEVSIRKYKPLQVFRQGEVISYSNYGIALAAYVIQRITGQDFYRYVEDNIFKPLGMTKTSFELDFHGVQISKAYSPNGRETFEPLINIYPEGSVVSTATDMSKYMQWLIDDSNKVISREAKQQIFERQFAMSDEFEGTGYTWNRHRRNGVLYYDKKGETVNFFTRIAIYPTQKKGVFISFNSYINEENLDRIMDGVTNLILSQEKTPDLFTGSQTADISGYYISTRSSFENPEKILNLFITNRVFHITGSPYRGFSLNGEKLVPIGENYYSTSKGNFKYVENKGSSYLANNTPISYVRTNWYNSREVNVAVLVLFIVFLLILAVTETVKRSHKKGGLNKYLAGLSIIQIGLFLGICFLIYSGFSNYSMLAMVPFLNMCGIFMAITIGCGVLYTVYVLCTRKIVLTKKFILIGWNLSGIFFCLWMIQFKIL